MSARHIPSWLLLAAAAGMVNATALLACQRFVSHVTGTVTRLGMTAEQVSVLAIDFGVVVLCFILGAMSSVVSIQGRTMRGKRPVHALPLILVGATLCLVASLGHLDLFGRFGAEVDTLGDFALLSMLSFAMGMQNASVATSTGQLVRTTHLTGPATDLGVGLASSLYLQGSDRTEVLRVAALRAGKIVAFATGAGLAVPLARNLQYLTFFVPAAFVFTAAFLSFRVARLG